MVSALDSGSKGPGSSPGRVIVTVLCSWTRRFPPTGLFPHRSIHLCLFVSFFIIFPYPTLNSVKRFNLQLPVKIALKQSGVSLRF